tara:strand:+ start:190 stop:555 length:366 start_codon:yes stop_codon:yes gene_type:complete
VLGPSTKLCAFNATQATCESHFVNGFDGTPCAWGAGGTQAKWVSYVPFDGTVQTFNAEEFRVSKQAHFTDATAVVVDQMTQQTGSVIGRYRMLFAKAEHGQMADRRSRVSVIGHLSHGWAM